MRNPVKVAAKVAGGLTVLLGVALAGLMLLLILAFSGAPSEGQGSNLPPGDSPVAIRLQS